HFPSVSRDQAVAALELAKSLLAAHAVSNAPPAAEPLVIRCRENGPLVIRGAIKVIDHAGNEFALPVGKETIALCRCGQSKNKPFCDGSHRQCAFQAGELAKPKEPGAP